MNIYRSTLPAILGRLPIKTGNPDELVQSALAMYDTQAVSPTYLNVIATIDPQSVHARRQLKVPDSGTYGSRHMRPTYLIS
jgi:hypothetical protein